MMSLLSHCHGEKTKDEIQRNEGLEGKAYTLHAYSKAMKRKVRFVIWIMPNNKHKIFFSTKLTMTGEEVLRTYRSRFQIEFCYRDAKSSLSGSSKLKSRSVEKRLRFLEDNTDNRDNNSQVATSL